MKINGMHNLIFGYAPIFKGNDKEKQVISQASDISDNSVSSKAIASYTKGLINAQTNPINAENESKEIIEQIRKNMSKYLFEELYPKLQTTSPDKLKKINELLNIKVINSAGEECPALWESCRINWFLDNKCDLDSVIDCVKMTYKDENGVAKNIFDAHIVGKFIEDGIDITSPDFKKLATITRDDANWYVTGQLYGDDFDKYGTRSEIFKEGAWKSRHKAPRFRPYEITEFLKSNIDINSDRFKEILNLNYKTETGELRPLTFYPSEIIEFYNSDIKDLKRIETLAPLDWYYDNGNKHPFFTHSNEFIRVANHEDFDTIVELVKMRDYSKPNAPSIFYPWKISEILDEGLDLKVISALAKQTKKDHIKGDIVPKFDGYYEILKEAKKFGKFQEQYLEPIKDEEFKSLLNKFYISENFDINEASKAIDAYNNAINNYTTLKSADGYSKPYWKEYMEYCKENGIDIKRGIDTKMRYMDFVEAQRFDQLIDYCKNNNNELSKYMYENLYLKNKNFPPEVLEKLIDINNEFGTKVFLPSNISWESEEYVQFIKDELSEWKRASSDKAKYPPVLDLLKAKMKYIDPKYNDGLGCSGYSECYSNKSISIDGFEELKRVLRHEIAHSNDNISVTAFPKLPYDNDNKGMIDYLKRNFWQEFRNGGISEGHIDYAFKNPREFIAVALEGEMNRYSQEFINQLKEFGMPDWCRLLRKIVR